MQESGKLLIVCDDIEGEALSTLILNKLRGVLNIVAVKAPGFGDKRKAMLEDIAILTGAEVITSDLGLELKDTQITQLGRAKQVKVQKENTIIVDGMVIANQIKVDNELIPEENIMITPDGFLVIKAIDTDKTNLDVSYVSGLEIKALTEIPIINAAVPAPKGQSIAPKPDPTHQSGPGLRFAAALWALSRKGPPLRRFQVLRSQNVPPLSQPCRFLKQTGSQAPRPEA